MLKKCKTKEYQYKLQQLKLKDKVNEEDHMKDGETRLKTI
jgi:hypothetical protein